MLAVLYFLAEYGVPDSLAGRIFAITVLTVGSILALGAGALLLLKWRTYSTKERLQLALAALFL